MTEGQVNIEGVSTPMGGEDSGFVLGDLIFAEADEDISTQDESAVEKPGVEASSTATPPTQATAPAKQESQINYKQTLLDVFDADLLPTLEIEQDGEVKQVTISDIEELDEETYLEVLKSGIETLKENATKDKVDITTLSPFLQNAITAEKEGLSSKSSVDFYTEHEKPLENFDLDSEDGQEAFLVYMREKYSGDSLEDARTLVNSWKQRGELEHKATDANNKLKTWLQNQEEAEKAELAEAAKKAKEDILKFKDNAKTALDSFELNQKTKEAVLDKLSKVTKGNRYEIDALYLEARKDPEKSALLAFFLSNPDEFTAQISRKKVTEHQIKTGKTIKVLRSDGISLNKEVSDKKQPSTTVKSNKTEKVETEVESDFVFG